MTVNNLIKYAKDCPFGCPRTAAGVYFYSSGMVACRSCSAKSPPIGKIIPRSSTPSMMGKAAILSWNARTTAQKAATLEIIRDYAALEQVEFDKPNNNPAEWRACLCSYGTFVPQVEYKIQPHKDGWTATDDEGASHTVPLKVFGPH